MPNLLLLLVRPRVLVAVLLTLLTLLILQFPIESGRFTHSPFSASRTASPPLGSHPTNTSRLAPTLDIVISLFKENLTHTRLLLDEIRSLKPLTHLQVNCHVYTKEEGANIKQIRATLRTPFVTALPNTGREGGTYLSHIILNWDRLARHTMFVQAEIHDFDNVKGKILDYFSADTGVLPLNVLESCECIACSDPWDTSRTFPRIGELYSALNGRFCPKTIALTYTGQVLVSATRIRKRNLGTYIYIKQTLESAQSHFIHKDPRQDQFKDSPSDPYLGHTIERSYMVLWGCDSSRITERCGGLDGLRQRRKLYHNNDRCQCLDT
jgi:hypothetical protein